MSTAVTAPTDPLGADRARPGRCGPAPVECDLLASDTDAVLLDAPHLAPGLRFRVSF